jgi:hypothetical protein
LYFVRILVDVQWQVLVPPVYYLIALSHTRLFEPHISTAGVGVPVSWSHCLVTPNREHEGHGLSCFVSEPTYPVKTQHNHPGILPLHQMDCSTMLQ